MNRRDFLSRSVLCGVIASLFTIPLQTTAESVVRPVRLTAAQRKQVAEWFRRQYVGVEKNGLPVEFDSIIQDIKIIHRKPREMSYKDA